MLAIGISSCLMLNSLNFKYEYQVQVHIQTKKKIRFMMTGTRMNRFDLNHKNWLSLLFTRHPSLNFRSWIMFRVVADVFILPLFPFAHIGLHHFSVWLCQSQMNSIFIVCINKMCTTNANFVEIYAREHFF